MHHKKKFYSVKLVPLKTNKNVLYNICFWNQINTIYYLKYKFYE